MARYFMAYLMARYFMAYFIWTSCLVAGQSPKYVLKGLEVNLKPDITGHPDDILWKHNGNKVVEFNGNEEQVYNSYKNRITLDWVSAELNITDLRFEDSGDYELEVYVNNLLHHSRFVLKVIDKVAKPNISCEMNDGSSSNISGKLLCSAEPRRPQSLMKFEWISHGNVQLGPELIISLGNKHDDEVYSCRVSNHLGSETATFMAKDCYPDKSILVVAVSVVAILLILLLICMAIFFYLRHRKGKSNDLENQSQHGSREDKTTDQEEEKRPLMNSDPASKHKEDNTFQESPDMAHADPDQEEESNVADKIKFFETKNNKEVQPKHADKTTDQEEEKRPLMNSDPASKHKEDGNSHQITVEPTEKNSPGSESSTCEKRNEPESDGSKEEADEDEEAQSAPASAETSTAQPCSPLTKSSPNMAPKGTAGEHKEVSDSDQVTGETVRESDSSGIQQKRNESDDFSEEKQSSTIPEQKGSEIPVHEQDSNLSQEEIHTRKDNQQETDKPVSEDESKSDSVGDHEEKEKEQDLYLATSQHPQSPAPTKPDNRNTFQESPDTAHADPDREEEGKTRHDSDESEGQPDSSTEDADKGNVADKIQLFETKNNKEVQPKHPDKTTDQEEEKRPLMNSDPASKHKEDGNSHQITVEPTEKNSPGSESSTCEKRNEPESDGSKEEADEDEEAQSAPASAETSTAQPCSPLTKSSPNMAPKGTAGEHKEVSDSDQVTGETVRESDSSGIQQKRNESDDFSEEKQSSTIPEQKGSEIPVHEQDSNLSQEEIHTRKDNQQETDKPVSEDESKSDSVGDHEEKEKEQDLYLATSQHPQSPAPTKPDNRNTFQESPDTAHADPDREEEGKTRHDSDESEGQPDSSTEDADKGNVADKIQLFETKNNKEVQPKHPDKTTDQEEEKRPLMNSDPASKHKEDGNSHQITVEPTEKNSPGSESSTCEKRNEPESDGSKEEADEDEEAQSAPASAETSTAQPCSPLTKSSPNMAPKGTAGEHKEVSDSDQVTGETVRESDSSGIQQKRNESDDFSEEKQSSTIPEQKGSEIPVHEQDSNLSQEEIHTRKDNQQETDKPVSEDESKSDSVGDHEEKEKEQDLYLATSQHPQSPAPTKPDNRNTFQESPDTAHADPDREEEGKTRHDSDESEGQPDSSTEDADKGNVADKIQLFETKNNKEVQPKHPDKTTDQEEEKRPLMNSDPASKHKEDGNSHQITVEPTEKNSPGSESSTCEKRNEPESDGSKEEADEDEEAQSAPASAETSTAQPCSPLTKSSPNMAPKGTAGEHKEVSDSDQVTGETVRESDSSGIQQKRNESDEEKQETSKPISAENESDSVGDGEEKDKEQDLYLATSQHPQSPAPTKPDNRNTFQESPDTAHADPDREEEGKTRHDSDESEGQPVCPKSLSEDEEGQKKAEVVA